LVPPKVTDDMTLVRRHSGTAISGFKGSGNAIARPRPHSNPSGDRPRKTCRGRGPPQTTLFTFLRRHR